MALAASTLALSACSDDNETTAPSFTRVYHQVERPGNPLVSEVMLAKRNHGFHDKGMPSTDDVVDAGLMAIFGALLNPNNVSPGLTTDNVGANDKPFSATFPYLPKPTT